MEYLMKKKFGKTSQTEFRVKKVIKRKVDKLCQIDMLIFLPVGLIKKILWYKMSYFPEPHTHTKLEIKVELDLSNYPTKSDLKSATGVDLSEFAK